jgi:hypothetical protein
MKFEASFIKPDFRLYYNILTVLANKFELFSS